MNQCATERIVCETRFSFLFLFRQKRHSAESEIFLILTLHTSRRLEPEEFLRAQFQVDCTTFADSLRTCNVYGMYFFNFPKTQLYIFSQWMVVTESFLEYFSSLVWYDFILPVCLCYFFLSLCKVVKIFFPSSPFLLFIFENAFWNVQSMRFGVCGIEFRIIYKNKLFYMLENCVWLMEGGLFWSEE